MFRTEVLIFLLISYLSPSAFAFGEISFGASLGVPDVRIQNEDGSLAYYEGLAFKGRTGINLISTNNFFTDLNFNINYMDLENRANTGDQKESGRHLGGGLDLSFRMYRFVAGYSYYQVDAKHYWVGNVTNDFKRFNYTKTGWYAGLDFNISKSTMLGVVYTANTANLPKDEMETSKDLKFDENTIYLRLTVSTSETIADFFSFIFGT